MDSLLEGDGFELPVPVRQAKLTRSCQRSDAGTVAARKSGSHATLCWREMDSNFRFRASSSRLEAEILLLQGAHRRWWRNTGAVRWG